MISETDVVNGYMWILGRIPGEAERARFAEAGPNSVLDFQQELLSSDEFRGRRLLMQRMWHLERAELDQRRLAFVHIEKSGGTTLHEMLCSQVPASLVCPERHASIGDWTVNELARYRLFSGHFDLAYCRSMPGRIEVLTMLREPKARLMSLYRFWKAHRPHPERDFYDLVLLARALSAEDFFSHPRVVRHPSLRDAIAGQLTRTASVWALLDEHRIIADPQAVLAEAWAALEAMAGFGILERFEESRVLLNRQLGLDMRPVAPRQVLAEMVRDSAELVDHPAEPMTGRLEGLLEAMTPIDRPLYDRARALFEARVRTISAPPEILRGLRRWFGR